MKKVISISPHCMIQRNFHWSSLAGVLWTSHLVFHSRAEDGSTWCTTITGINLDINLGSCKPSEKVYVAQVQRNNRLTQLHDKTHWTCFIFQIYWSLINFTDRPVVFGTNIIIGFIIPEIPRVQTDDLEGPVQNMPSVNMLSEILFLIIEIETLSCFMCWYIF